jgi:hypothetical protein
MERTYLSTYLSHPFESIPNGETRFRGTQCAFSSNERLIRVRETGDFGAGKPDAL